MGGERDVLFALVVGLGVFGGLGPATAGTLKGRVRDEGAGGSVERVTVRACPAGRSQAVGVRTEGDGSFLLRDLAAGRYAVCLGQGESYRPVVAPSVEVGEADVVELSLKVARSVMIHGDSWTQAYASFGQSFVASGLGVTMVGIKGYGPGRRVQIGVLEGEGTKGRENGPARTTNSLGGEGTETVSWGGGEVPTVPGGRYTLRMSGVGGQKWVPGVAGRGDVYAQGSAWFGEGARALSDLGVCICEDSDGLRTDYAVGGGWRTLRAAAVGQTFVALSREVTFASAVLSGVGGPPVYVRFSVHESGPGGRQIGPSKTVGVGEDAAVAWVTGEVPVTPGKRYYVHIESLSGAVFLAAVQPDGYGAGHAWRDATVEEGWDLCAVVAGSLDEKEFGRLVGHRASRQAVMLVNNSFEMGIEGWGRDGTGGEVVGCDGGVIPMWGTRMFGWTNRDRGEGTRAFVYQAVGVESGERYCFSGSVYTDHEGGRSSDVKARLLVLPAGGTDWRNNERIETSQWYATEGQWRRGSVEFRAAAETIVVGFDLEQRWDLARSSLYIDGAWLERVGGGQ